MGNSDLFEKGLKKRRQVLGEKYVDANLAGSDDFMMTFQRAVTELAWGLGYEGAVKYKCLTAFRVRGGKQ